MIVKHLLTHGLAYAAIADGLLLLMMLTASPRVWGYADYSEEIKAKVPPQTAEERRLATIIAVPWMLLVVGLPILSTYVLKSKLGGAISFWAAFLNILVLVFLTTVGDLVFLDWLIVSTITPNFVIIPGTEKVDYKDFSHHYKAHLRAIVPLLAACLVLAGIVVLI